MSLRRKKREPEPTWERVEPPYYEVTVRLPLDLYDEAWFDRVSDAAGDYAAVSGQIVPEGPPNPPPPPPPARAIERWTKEGWVPEP